MKIGYLVALLLVASLPASAAGPRKRHAVPPAPADPDYVFALSAANRFLQAWQTGDLEAGTVLLSDQVRHSQDPEKFEKFFSGATGRAFEISRGTGNRGRYQFDVVLVTVAGARIRRRSSAIVVANSGKNDWVVDKLP